MNSIPGAGRYIAEMPVTYTNELLLLRLLIGIYFDSLGHSSCSDGFSPIPNLGETWMTDQTRQTKNRFLTHITRSLYCAVQEFQCSEIKIFLYEDHMLC